jgi:hypothetical protein
VGNELALSCFVMLSFIALFPQFLAAMDALTSSLIKRKKNNKRISIYIFIVPIGFLG